MTIQTIERPWMSFVKSLVGSSRRCCCFSHDLWFVKTNLTKDVLWSFVRFHEATAHQGFMGGACQGNNHLSTKDTFFMRCKASVDKLSELEYLLWTLINAWLPLPIQFVYCFFFQNLQRHIFCRAIKTKNRGVTAIAFQCPLWNFLQNFSLGYTLDFYC